MGSKITKWKHSRDRAIRQWHYAGDDIKDMREVGYMVRLWVWSLSRMHVELRAIAIQVQGCVFCNLSDQIQIELSKIARLSIRDLITIQKLRQWSSIIDHRSAVIDHRSAIWSRSKCRDLTWTIWWYETTNIFSMRRPVAVHPLLWNRHSRRL